MRLRTRQVLPRVISVLVLLGGLPAAPVYAGVGCTIVGSASADVLHGGRRNDVICGGGGADTIFGGGGSDRLLGGNGRDLLHGGAGEDVLSGGDGNDTIAGDTGDDSINGGGGIDVVDFTTAPRGVTADLSAGTATGHGQDSIRLAESVTGSASADLLRGNSSGNRLLGGEGDDVLRGGGGDDGLLAGAGDDALVGGAGNDTLKGGSDDDVLDGGLGVNTCRGGTGHDILKPNCDLTPPRVRSLSLSPPTIDTSQEPGTLRFEARVTDELAGVASGSVSLRAPSRGQYQIAYWNSHDLVEGDNKDGMYEFELTLPRYAEQGTWTVSGVFVRDEVGNGRSLWLPEQLQQAGLDLSFDQTGPGDVTAPHFAEFSLASSVVDTSSGPATVVAEAQLTDDLAGVQNADVTFRSPSGGQSVRAFFNESSRVQGDGLDGTYRSELTLPRFAEQGTWKVDYASVGDLADNGRSFQFAALDRAGLALTLEQVGPGDSTPPALQSLAVSPAEIDTSQASATILVEGRVTDKLAGFASTKIEFCSPDRTQSHTTYWHEANRLTGDSHDGVYRSEMTIPRYAAPGTWFVCRAYVKDEAGNTRHLDSVPFSEATFFNDP